MTDLMTMPPKDRWLRADSQVSERKVEEADRLALAGYPSGGNNVR